MQSMNDTFSSAKGLEHQKFAISFQPDKIIFTPKDQGDIHYTLHLGGRSGTIDVRNKAVQRG